MPANLPPQYYETERKLRQAKTSQEKVAILEELLTLVPKHKGTEKLQALLKTKIAKLKAELQKKPAVSRHGGIPRIEKTGAAQIIVIGPPNSGKSSLIKALTAANPEIADYPFTTRTALPFMMPYENIQIQLIDTPPITADYMETWVPELIKVADAALLVVELTSPDPASDMETILLKLKEKKIEIVSENYPGAAERQVFFKKTLVIANKIDEPSSTRNLEDLKILYSVQFSILPVSALHGEGLEELKRAIFHLAGIIRVYSKAPGKRADLESPFTLKKGSTLLDMARAIHKDFMEKLKYARIWGKKTYPGQMVTRDYVLEDGDIVELHI